MCKKTTKFAHEVLGKGGLANFIKKSHRKTSCIGVKKHNSRGPGR